MTGVVEWPLWGLHCGDRRQLTEGLRLGPGLVYQPTWDDWGSTDKGDVVSELAGYPLALERTGQSVRGWRPPALFLCSGETDDLSGSELVGDFAAAARDVFDALRLWKGGDFIDPELVGWIVELDDVGIQRQAGVYRSGFYLRRFVHPYRLAPDDLAGVSELYDLLQTAGAAHPNLVLAIEHFRIAFGADLHPDERLTLLFAALEALLGEFGMTVAGAPLPLRAARASGVSKAQQWLETSGAKLRKTVAHGRGAIAPPDLFSSAARADRLQLDDRSLLARGSTPLVLLGVGETVNPDLDRTAEITRKTITSYLRFAAEMPAGEDVVAEFNVRLAHAP